MTAPEEKPVPTMGSDLPTAEHPTWWCGPAFRRAHTKLRLEGTVAICGTDLWGAAPALDDLPRCANCLGALKSRIEKES